MSILRRFVGAAMLFLAFSPVCHSQVGPRLQISSDTKDNVEPAVAFSPVHNSYLAVWTSKQDLYTWDIWARVVTSEGTFLPMFNVESGAGVILRQPAVAYGSTQDQYLVAYVEELSASNSNIWAVQTRWNEPGTASIIAVDTGSGFFSGHPAVAYNSQDDEFLVVYEDRSTGVGEIKAVRVTASTGSATAWQTIAVSNPVWDTRSRPDVAYDPVNNRYIVAYEYDDYISVTKILVRTVSADLTSISPEYDVVTESDYVGSAAVSVGPQGALVSWLLKDLLTSSIYARRIELDGSPLGATNGFLVLGGTPNLHKVNPDVCYVATGEYLVVWESEDKSTNYGNVQGGFVSSTRDQLLGSRFGIDTSAGDQTEAAVACDTKNSSLVVLADYPAPPPNDYDVVGHLVSSILFADGFESGDTIEWSTSSP
jgi:hypothetical protein